MKPRYLTKSRFKLGVECPTKLFYTGKKEYANQKQEDSFLMALAEGGFQVGELAKLCKPEGKDIITLDNNEAMRETNEELEKENAIIYEAAIKYENLFIRVDVLVKQGNTIKLYEVKAKSYDPSDAHTFIGKRGKMVRGWKPYLYDIAFQKHVVSEAFPQYEIKAHLTLVDKTQVCGVDGLNQKFKLEKKDNRTHVIISDTLSDEDLAQELLIDVSVDDICSGFYDGTYKIDGFEAKRFDEVIQLLSEIYQKDEKYSMPVSNACGSCEFYTNPNDDSGLKSGLKECWKAQLNWKDEDFDAQTIFDIWNFRGKDKLIKEKVIKIDDVSEIDITDGKTTDTNQRQWLQVSKYQSKDTTEWLDKEGLKAEIGTWKFPLHFIDFETSAVAIPFHKGLRPYENVAFQFSHHVVYEDGKVEHKGEYLNVNVGKFPNFEFLINLKKELEQDEGTIFRYAPHENTILNHIYRQLKSVQWDVPDREELCEFIKDISHSTGTNKKEYGDWQGARDMVDMWDLVKKYYYHPYMKGSNSIKAVLPAILNSSEYLQNKYSKPIYGASDGIASKNYKDMVWIEKDENRELKDPYKLLPDMYEGYSQDVIDEIDRLIVEEGGIANGGEALVAYAKMQFTEMTAIEREEISKSLLKYCELDTLAMVMIYEGWREKLRN